MNIFTFGSNLIGKHGAGAAKAACMHHGAQMGVGEGPTGNSYAIPTKDESIASRSFEDIKLSVDKFITYAAKHPEYTFQVTRIGCGLAGFTDAEIAPMFIFAPINCQFDSAWKSYLPDAKFWGTF